MLLAGGSGRRISHLRHFSCTAPFLTGHLRTHLPWSLSLSWVLVSLRRKVRPLIDSFLPTIPTAHPRLGRLGDQITVSVIHSLK